MEVRGNYMETEIELIKAEAEKDDQGGETTHLWFEAVIDGKTYGNQLILCDPSSYTNSMWQWENLEDALEFQN